MEITRYQDAAIDSRILRAVEEMGFVQMTPIQEQAIPVLLERKDVIGQAQTGTGKTAAFGIPVIQNTDPDIPDFIRQRRLSDHPDRRLLYAR